MTAMNERIEARARAIVQRSRGEFGLVAARELAKAELQTEARSHVVAYIDGNERVGAQAVDDTYLAMRAEAIRREDPDMAYEKALELAQAETLALAAGRFEDEGGGQAA